MQQQQQRQRQRDGEKWHNYHDDRVKKHRDQTLAMYRQYTMERTRLLGEAENCSNFAIYLAFIRDDSEDGDIVPKDQEEYNRLYNEYMDQVEVIDRKLMDLRARYPNIRKQYRDYVVQDRVQYSRKTEYGGDVDDCDVDVQKKPLKRKLKIN